MNPLEYTKEIKHPPPTSRQIKPTIYEHCQMNVHWNSHHHKLHYENVSFGVITHFRCYS